MLNHNVRLEELMPLIREQLDRGQSVRMMPRGVSMMPMLRQGVDSVVLSPLPERLKKYDLPLYQRENGQYVLHRVIRAGETYTCMGDNQFTPEPGLKHGQMIALVTAFYRGEKEHRVDEFAHRLYCRLWYYSRPVRRVWRSLLSRVRRLFV